MATKKKSTAKAATAKKTIIDQSVDLLKKYQNVALEQVEAKRSQARDAIKSARVAALTEAAKRIGALSHYVGELAKKG